MQYTNAKDLCVHIVHLQHARIRVDAACDACHDNSKPWGHPRGVPSNGPKKTYPHPSQCDYLVHNGFAHQRACAPINASTSGKQVLTIAIKFLKQYFLAT